MKKAQWHALQMGENFGPQIVNHRFPQFERKALAKVEGNLCE